jgi:hypothetical protein
MSWGRRWRSLLFFVVHAGLHGRIFRVEVFVCKGIAMPAVDARDRVAVQTVVMFRFRGRRSAMRVIYGRVIV